MRAYPIVWLLSLLLAASCSTDGVPENNRAYVVSEGPGGTTCEQFALKPPAEIFCGNHASFAAVVDRGQDGIEPFDTIFSSGRWATEIAARFDCEGAPLERKAFSSGGTLLTKLCKTRDSERLPQLLMAEQLNGQTWVARGEPAYQGAMERSIAVLAGREQPLRAAETNPTESAASTEELRRLAGEEGPNPGLYSDLLQRGGTAGFMGHWSEAQTAFEGALIQLCKIQNLSQPPCEPQKQAAAIAAVPSTDDIASTADLTMSIALQMSNQGQFDLAERKFAQAANVATRPIDKARLQLYRASDEINQYDPGSPDNRRLLKALDYIKDSEKLFRNEAPPPMVRVAGTLDAWKSDGPAAQVAPDLPRSHIRPIAPTLSPSQKTALLGVAESLRVRSILDRLLGRVSQSEADALDADAFEKVYGLPRRIGTAQVSRTYGLALAAAQRTAQGGTAEPARTVLANFDTAQTNFDAASYWRPSIQSQLREAAELSRTGRPADGVRACEAAFQRLQQYRDYVENDLAGDCLGSYAAMATTDSGNAAAWYDKMFRVLQLTMRGSASEEIEKSAALLLRTADDPAIVARRDDIEKTSEEARRRTTAADNAKRKCADLPDPKTADTSAEATKWNADLLACEADIHATDQQAGEAVDNQARLEDALEAASPRYAQIKQSIKTTADIRNLLHPNETFAAIVLSERDGWIFLLRREDALPTVGHIAKGQAEIQQLVLRLRNNMGKSGLPSFADNAVAAHELYEAIFGDPAVRDTLARALKTAPPTAQDAPSLVVAASGPLLNVPFQVLLTQPPPSGTLANAAWLLNDFVIQNIPSAANFVLLRNLHDSLASGHRAPRPWFGVGAPVPVAKPAGYRAPTGCADSQSWVRGLPALPKSAEELSQTAQIFSAGNNERLSGAAFTVNDILHPPAGVSLDNFNILHFATHAIVQPGCRSEPAIVASLPTGSRNLGDALLTASSVRAHLTLNADAVVLSACSSGASERIFSASSHGQEEMSTLATSFFAAGARSVLGSLWSANADWTPYLITRTLSSLKNHSSDGIAVALRREQIALIKERDKEYGEVLPPSLWGPFVVIGDGGRERLPAQTRISSN